MLIKDPIAVEIMPIGKKMLAPVAHFGCCVADKDSIIPFALTIIEAKVQNIPNAIIRIIIKKFGNF
jgi:hypothetical protein